MKVTSTLTTEDGDNISYLDCNVINDSNKRVQAAFTVNRSGPIIENPEDYYASIVRFTIPLTSVPLMRWFANRNFVSVSYAAVTETAEAKYQQTDFNTHGDVPSNVVPGGVYSYQTVCNSVNVAIAQCCTTLGLPVPPYMVYDDGTFTIFFPSSWADVYPYTNALKPHLFFDRNLFGLFVSFNNMSYDLNQNNNYLDYQIICCDNKNNSSGGLISNTQEWSSTQYMQQLTNISIVSQKMPCLGDDLANQALQTTSFGSESVKTITDFELDRTAPGGQRGQAQYQASVYRYIDLTGQKALRSLDFQFFCFFEDLLNVANVNSYRPLFLNPYETLSLKLMFKKKTLNY
jgi:hypothetical protein